MAQESAVSPLIDFTAKNAQAQASTQDTALQIHQVMDAQQAAYGDQMVQVATRGIAQQTIEAQKSAADMAVDSQNAAAKTATTGDWTDPGSKANYWAGEMQDNAAKAYAALDVVNQKKQATLLTDPLGWVNAQFTLPADTATYNYYADKHNVAESALGELTKSSNDAYIANANSRQRTSAEAAAASLQEVASNTQMQIDELAKANAGLKITGLEQLNKLSVQQASLAYTALTAQNQAEQMALAQRSADEQSKMRQLAFAQRQDVLDQKTVDREALQSQLDMRNAGARAKEMPTLDNVKMFQQEYAFRKNDPTYQTMLNVGSMIQANGGSTTGVMLGKSSGEIARDWASPSANVSGNPTGQFLAQIYESERGKNQPMISKDPIGFADHVTQVADTAAKAMAANINTDKNPNNIYAAPPINVVLQARSVANGNAFINSAVKPLLAKDTTATVPDSMLVGQMINYATSGNKGDLDTATNGLAAYYQAAVIQNNLIKRYVENGLPPQKGYPANINGTVVDLADKTALRTLVLKSRISQFPAGAIFNPQDAE